MQNEYYIVYSKCTPNVPMLTLFGATTELMKDHIIENPKPIEFFMCDPVPRKVNLADFMTCPEAVISDKIMNVLKPLNIFGIQFLPGMLLGEKEEQDVMEGYWGLHIYNKIACIDKKLSICKMDVGILSADKLVLDKKILQAIPLEERLVFRLKEDHMYQTFHVSIVEKIMAVNPTNIQFVRIEDVSI